MITKCTSKLRIVSCMVLLSVTVISVSATAQPATEIHSTSLEKSLRGFLQNWIGKPDGTRYIPAFVDLNGDKRPEAIVYLLGNGWCGSGGCNTLVLAQHGKSWRIVTNIRVSHTPIRVLAKVKHGWNSIGVLVAGGGIINAYEAELDFNGKTYPTNPTVPPSLKLKSRSVGEIVIPSTKDAVSLYNSD